MKHCRNSLPRNYATGPLYDSVNVDPEDNKMYRPPPEPSQFLKNPTSAPDAALAPIVPIQSLPAPSAPSAPPAPPAIPSLPSGGAERYFYTNPPSYCTPEIKGKVLGCNEAYAYANVDGTYASSDRLPGSAPGGCVYTYLGAPKVQAERFDVLQPIACQPSCNKQVISGGQCKCMDHVTSERYNFC